MGSGDRVTLYRTGAFGLGLNVMNFPFTLTVNVMFLFWGLSVGFGKAYDELQEKHS